MGLKNIDSQRQMLADNLTPGECIKKDPKKPWKINMEPTNQPFGKENDLNRTSMIMFHVNLPGCELEK